MRRFFALSFAISGMSAVMLAATFLAQARGLSRVGVWWTPQEVSQSGVAASRGPRLVADSSGYLHLLWMDDTLGQPDLYYVKSGDQGNTWSDAEHIPTSLDSYQGSVAVGTNQTIHACWWDGTPPYPPYELFYAQRTSSGWTIDEPSVVVTNSQIQEPLVAEASNAIHVVWSNWLQAAPDLYYSRRPVSGGEWLTATVIADTDPNSQHARMAIDKDGNLHLVWQENTSPNEIMYISGTVGTAQTTWSSPVTVSADLSLRATSPDIVAGDGVVHIVFGVDVADQQRTQDVYYASFPISNTDSISPTVIQGSRVAISQQLPTLASPSIALDGQNNVHVVWNGMKGTEDVWDRIYYAMSENQGVSWSPPIAISPDDAWPDWFPSIATDGVLAHVAWQQGVPLGDNDVYYAHSLPINRYFALALKDYQ